MRRRSGKKPGGQLGHPGETLHLVATSGTVVEHRPARCIACQAELDEAEVVARHRRQLQDLPRCRSTRRCPSAAHPLPIRCPSAAHPLPSVSGGVGGRVSR